MTSSMRDYLVITAGYWAFTLTDGAIRMLVVLHFHSLGYSTLEIASLFLFYEFFGIVTNLLGGWLGARIGLNKTMHIGMGLQVVALAMLTLPTAWLSVPYVMLAQALSGIAKDLNKMSAKASVKSIVKEGAQASLFKWVALLTGSKNALKGAGFFLGALLLHLFTFRGSLIILASGLLLVLLLTYWLLPNHLGKAPQKPKFQHIFSNKPAINRLSAARFFLFGARDVWFVVALPVYLTQVLHWQEMQVGGFMALWVIGYGIIQAIAPKLLGSGTPGPTSAIVWALLLALFPAGIALSMQMPWPVATIIPTGLILFGAVFAINSALHSYLILAYADHDKVAMNVGFYYMANAGGRLVGTVLSGWVYTEGSLVACLWVSSAFLLATGLISLSLPPMPAPEQSQPQP
ncbi:major facilitator superfamily MFS_1 [Magnetococcus marinus MC-1]|uniref:Major facilitator superfamily MFS_1 n=1 Tax=Magnetococcus marinus (strain ATCC BAA-1437 / JCM 17883 / MC-1) TaxID=156889 RepID=A0LBW9_MAGMM|nr:organoarsenical effux MFS transporter ArsJ [Magnetococcus marinus]ABK45462.1 major facilitator superfamily MFS_1 [Magnetococcus marinus MC-1]